MKTSSNSLLANKKTLIIGLSILLLIGAGIFLYMTQNINQSNSANRNVVTQKELSYSFSHPSTLVFSPRNQNPQNEEEFKDSHPEIVDPKGEYFIVLFGPYDWSLEEIVARELASGPTKNAERKDMVVDGHKAVMLTQRGTKTPEIHVYIEHVKIPKYSGPNIEELEDSINPVSKGEELFGTLDVMLTPFEEDISEERYKEAIKQFTIVVNSLKFANYVE